MADSNPNAELQLLTEHFGYPPVSLLDDIINAVNLLAERALTSIEQGLGAAPPTSLGFGRPPRYPLPKTKTTTTKGKRNQQQQPIEPPPPIPTTPEDIAAAASLEIENGTHQLETLLCASIDRNFDLVELYVMRNILCVRPEDRDWIRLAHYEGLDLGGGTPPPSSDQPTVESVTTLRRKLQASRRLNAALHEERAHNEHLLAELRRLVGRPAAEVKAEEGRPPVAAPLDFLRDRGELAATDVRTPLSTTTAFTLSQLQSLRAVSAALRTLAPEVRAAVVVKDTGTDADADADVAAGARQEAPPSPSHSLDEDDPHSRRLWRRRRAEYVEAAARRHLEVVRGLELGQQGEVRDGEWQAGGRRPGSAEVEGLERIIAATLEVDGDDHMDES